MDVTRTSEWFRDRVNHEARRQWAARPTGVKCAGCGGEIVARDDAHAALVRAASKRVALRCAACEGRGE